MTTEHTGRKREITDMAGRRVLVPDPINSIYAPSPYGFTILCSLAPELLPGLLQPVSDQERRFLPVCLHNLPVLGLIKNSAEIAQAKPDVVVVWAETENPVHQKSEDILGKLGLPYVYVTVGDLANLYDYPAAYEFLGELLHRRERAAELADYGRVTLLEAEQVVAAVAPAQRPKVYYAEGKDGLSTEFDDSLHAHLLRLAGDVNVIRGHIATHAGLERITFPELAAADPDVILVWMRQFFTELWENADWQSLRAVRNRKVFQIPLLPFNWFDRPPSFMRFLGLKWLLKMLYPEHYHIDHIAETRKFFQLFLGMEIDETTADQLFSGNFAATSPAEAAYPKA